MFRTLSLHDVLGVVQFLQQKAIRVTFLALALPVSWLGRELLPADLPQGGLPELIAGDLGAVAAGIFLSFLGTLLALCYGLGTLGAVAAHWGRLRPAQSAWLLVSAITLLAISLYIAGRAFSWLGALWMLLAAGGTVWGGSKFWPMTDPAAGQAQVYDPAQSD